MQEINSLQQDLSQAGDASQGVTGDWASQLKEKDVLIEDLKSEIHSYEDKQITMVGREEHERIQAEVTGLNRQIENSQEKLTANELEIARISGKLQEEKEQATYKTREIQSLSSKIR